MRKFFVKITSIIILLISFGQIFAQETNKTDSLTRIFFSENNPQKKIAILIELMDLSSSSDPDKAFDFANQTLELAEENNDQKSKLKAYLVLGELFRKKTDFRKSLEIANKAKLLASDLDLTKEYAESILLIALNFSNLSDYKKSANLNFQALQIFEELDDKKGIGKTLDRIGTVYYKQDNYDKALEYYTQSLNIAREIKDLTGISRGLNNMAIIYTSLGENKIVKSKLEEAVKINKIINRPLWEGINYSNLGNLFRRERKYDSSLMYYRKASNIYTKLNDRKNLAKVDYNLCLYYKDLKLLDSSLYYAKRAYDIGRENNLKLMVFNAVKQQRIIYHQLNDIDSAFKFCMLELQLKDSLDTKNTLAQISQLELNYEFDKREQESKIKQQRREYIFIIAGTAIVFILLILVIIIVTRNRLKAKNTQIERRRLNLELETRNRELTANVMTLIRKNEILSEMGVKLMDIQNEAVREETKSAIKKIALELQNTTNNEIWDDFDIRFKQVHGEFYEKLIEQFPDLSPNEHRLCAFLRLNMTTKEISELTGQRPETLDVARTRLRKKLGLTNTKTQLISFLTQI